MFVDASAIVSVLLGETDGAGFLRAIDRAPPGTLVSSPIAIWEAAAAVSQRKGISVERAEDLVDRFVAASEIAIEAIEALHVSLALRAFDLHGRHRFTGRERNRALNLADCFHYASAKAKRVAILTKDPGFASTDLPVVPT